ncbi:MAG TPA: hypothetical protein VGS12_11090 [Caulobacteraceae bacterium]|nr:hypothetical protein [Caulobacteraceae bacterium]
MNVDKDVVITALAVENWRLVRTLMRVARELPLSAQERTAAVARYADRKLTNLLADAGMQLETFDGRSFDASLPVSPVNIGDFESEAGLIIQETLEPAVLRDGRVAAWGKVILSEGSGVSRD